MGKCKLFVPNKLDYARGVGRPEVECILCEIAARRDTVCNLEVARAAGFVLSANMYPYNPGHLMIFPERHVEDPRHFTDDEALTLHRLSNVAMEGLAELYEASGFNVGYNYGSVSGASIAHFHLHVVPRYAREVGFVDIVGGARIIVEDPQDTCRRMADVFSRLLAAK